jgi:hypothetical protein
MANVHISTKKVQIDKSKATVVIIVAVAVFVTIFSLVSAKALYTQRSYQARVIIAKENARDQLEKNIASVEDLTSSYTEFVSTAKPNIIDGNPTGTGERDGDNARIILDALPSKYDYPALVTSLEKLMLDRKLKIEGIKGDDKELELSQVAENGQLIEVPFQIEAEGSRSSVQELFVAMEKSIRPFQAKKLKIAAATSNQDIKVTLDAITFVLPEKSFIIKTENVK